MHLDICIFSFAVLCPHVKAGRHWGQGAFGGVPMAQAAGISVPECLIMISPVRFSERAPALSRRRRRSRTWSPDKRKGKGDEPIWNGFGTSHLLLREAKPIHSVTNALESSLGRILPRQGERWSEAGQAD